MALNIIHCIIEVIAGFLLGILLFSAVSNIFTAQKGKAARAGYAVAAVALSSLALLPSLTGILLMAAVAGPVALGGELMERSRGAACSCFGDMSLRLRLLVPLIRRLIYACSLSLLAGAAGLWWAGPAPAHGYQLGSGLLVFLLAMFGLMHILLAPVPGKSLPERFPKAPVDWPGLPLVAASGAAATTLAAVLPPGAQRVILFGAQNCHACCALVERLAYLVPEPVLAGTVILAGLEAPRTAMLAVGDAAELAALKRLLRIEAFPTAVFVTHTSEGFVAERVMADILGRVIDIARTRVAEAVCA